MVTKIIKKDEDGKSVRFKIAAFKSYPTALQRRAYHLILNYLYDELPKNLSYIHEDDFFRLLESKAGHVQIDFPRVLKVKRSYYPSKVAIFKILHSIRQSTFQEKRNCLMARSFQLHTWMKWTYELIVDTLTYVRLNKFLFLYIFEHVKLEIG